MYWNLKCYSTSVKRIRAGNCQRIRCKSYVEQTPNDWFPLKVSGTKMTPVVKRYFFIPQLPIELKEGATIPATEFIDDHGKLVDQFMIADENDYVNLHINGIIQQGGMYSVGTRNITLKPVEGVILAGTPIIVEAVRLSA